MGGLSSSSFLLSNSRTSDFTLRNSISAQFPPIQAERHSPSMALWRCQSYGRRHSKIDEKRRKKRKGVVEFQRFIGRQKATKSVSHLAASDGCFSTATFSTIEYRSVQPQQRNPRLHFRLTSKPPRQLTASFRLISHPLASVDGTTIACQTSRAQIFRCNGRMIFSPSSFSTLAPSLRRH